MPFLVPSFSSLLLLQDLSYQLSLLPCLPDAILHHAVMGMDQGSNEPSKRCFG